MKQAIEQTLAGQRRIDQFDVLDGGDQRLAFDPGLVLLDSVQFGALGRIAGMQIGLTQTLGRLRQELRQQTAGAPAQLAAAPLLADGEAHTGRDLLGAQEIFMRGLLRLPPVSATRPW